MSIPRFSLHPSHKALRLLVMLAFALGIPLAKAYTYIAPHFYREEAQKAGRYGQVLLYEGRILEAYHALSKAIRYYPVGTMAAAHYNNLGLVYLEMKEPALAAASFQMAIRLQPVSAVYYENLARAYLVDEALPKRVKALADYLTYNPQHADAWFLLGVLYRALGDPRGTQAAWEQHLLLAPRSAFEGKICSESPRTCQKLQALDAVR